MRYKVGDTVKKHTGYGYPGVVVAAFVTTAGQERYVVEATGAGYEGMLHVFNEAQLEASNE